MGRSVVVPIRCGNLAWMRCYQSSRGSVLISFPVTYMGMPLRLWQAKAIRTTECQKHCDAMHAGYTTALQDGISIAILPLGT
jgi:hypothetical protein